MITDLEVKHIKEYIELRKQSVRDTYEKLIEPYYDKSIGMVNVSYMNKKTKEDFINKRNCLLVQEATYTEILEFIENKGIVVKELII